MPSRFWKIALAVLILSPSAPSPGLANKGCTDVQSKCAMQIGGRCDPVSGHWEYGRNGAGGNITTFNDCVSKSLRSQPKGK